MQRQLSGLESLTKQDIIRWADEFRKPSSLCAWTEEQSPTIFNSIVALDITSQLTRYTTIDTKMDALLSLAFPPAISYLIQGKIKKIKQADYCKIGDYFQDIECHTNQLSITTCWGKRVRD